MAKAANVVGCRLVSHGFKSHTSLKSFSSVVSPHYLQGLLATLSVPACTKVARKQKHNLCICFWSHLPILFIRLGSAILANSGQCNIPARQSSVQIGTTSGIKQRLIWDWARWEDWYSWQDGSGKVQSLLGSVQNGGSTKWSNIDWWNQRQTSSSHPAEVRMIFTDKPQLFELVGF